MHADRTPNNKLCIGEFVRLACRQLVRDNAFETEAMGNRGSNLHANRGKAEAACRKPASRQPRSGEVAASRTTSLL